MKYFLTALIYVFAQLDHSYVYGSNVVCSVFSDPVVFGKPVVLSCVSDDVTSCVKDHTRMWYIGELLSPVLFNGIPAKHNDKYSEVIFSCSEFYLRISNFSEIDRNDQYSCSVEFQKCGLTFNISHSKYEFHPLPQHIEIKHLNLSPTSLSLQIDLQKVYPVPKCFVTLGNNKHYIAIPQTVSPTGHFFKTSMNLTHVFEEEICPVDIYVRCLVGRTSMQILEKHFTNCTRVLASISHKTSDVSGYLVPLFLLLIVFLFCDCPLLSSLYRNKENIRNHLYSGNLLSRNCWDWRRPVLAIALTVIVLVMGVCSKVFSTIYFFDTVTGDCHDDIGTPIGLCVFSLLLTPLALCLISSPDTVSIREGFRVAGRRFDINKIIPIPCKAYGEIPLVEYTVNSGKDCQAEPEEDAT